MEKELRNLSLRKVLGPVLALAAAAAVLLAFSVPSVALLARGPEDLEELARDATAENLTGHYVTADVEYILDWYARTEKESGSVVEKEYIIPVGTAAYMGLVLPGPLVEEADRLQEETAAYLAGGVEPDWYLQVRGTVRPLEGESLTYYHDMFGYDSLTASQQALVLPVALYVGQVGLMNQNLALLLCAVGVLCALGALYCFTKALGGGYQKEIRAFCGGDALLREQVEAFYAEEQPLFGLRMGERFLMFQEGAATRLVDPSRIVWAYGQTVQHRTGGLPTGKTYGLVLRTGDGKMYTLPMKRDQVAQVLDALAERYPGWVLGYTDERAAVYRRDSAALGAAAAGQAPAGTAGAVDPDRAPQAAESAPEPVAESPAAPEESADGQEKPDAETGAEPDADANGDADCDGDADADGGEEAP